MAAKNEHNPKNRGLQGLLRQNFGPDEWGDSYLKSVWHGATFPFHLGGDDKDLQVFFGMIGIPATIAFVTLAYTDLVYLENFDVQVPHMQEDTISTHAFHNNGQRYMVQRDDESGGWALYVDNNGSDVDDLYVLVTDEEDALEIARNMQTEFGEVVEALTHDLGSMPESVPRILTYEGISPYYTDGSWQYRIADNNEQESAGAYILTGEQAQQSYALWQEIAVDIVSDDYNPIVDFAWAERASPQDNPFPNGFLAWLAITGGVYGAAMGLGALGGAVNGSARSQRRFKRDIS